MVPKDFEWLHGTRRALRFRQALGAVQSVGARLRERDYDIVEFFGGEFGLVTASLARLRRHPFLVAHTDGFELLASERQRTYDSATTIVGHLKNWYQDATHDRLSRAAFAHADAFVTGCELDQRRALQLQLFPQVRTAVIAPGLDDEYLATIAAPGTEPRIAFTGSWISRKGIRNVVQVMNSVLGERTALWLDLYGTGGGEAILDQFAPSVRQRICVHGRLTNQEIADGLAKTCVFFFPSQYEGFGMALAEAMACGCAPVTTPTGLGAELRDGEEALVCAFNDTAAMRRAIMALLDDAVLRSRVAIAAKKRVVGLDWKTQVGKLEMVYQVWLDGRRRASA